MPEGGYSEDILIERPAVALFAELGWEAVACFDEFARGGRSKLGREHKGEVVLLPRLRAALARLNPALPADAIEQAVAEVTRDRGAMSLVRANQEIYKLLKEGVPVTVPAADGRGEVSKKARVVDWDNPANNDFLLASQFWVTGEMYTRRADLVGFVNGLPLLFVELKAAHRHVQTAHTENLADYKDTIPHLFWYNAVIILSNGVETKVGSVSASWEHFADWKKIDTEGEEGAISLETAVRGVCRPDRFLDLIENFTLFMEVKGGLVKIVAKNHQYLGVNKALEKFIATGGRNEKLGVFWHTQGSGKSISMIFFSQKILRKIPGDWTFVVITDRRDLDDQIYKNFARSGVVSEKEAQAESSAELRRLLREDHRYVFTLIHKFRAEKGTKHPVLSERADVIVLTDEAHRTQYDALALNMRTALPNASFIAFTGTPLMVGEEKTREVFGDYVSVYNFRQSVDDGATVPLYYENRVPEVALINEDFNEDIWRAVDDAELSDDQEERLEHAIARQYHLITRDDRLETIAEDIVAHFMARGFMGKAMVVSIEKATAIRMYDKVKKYWGEYSADLRTQLASAPDRDKDGLAARIRYMEDTDMAVVISSSQGEVAEMRRRGLDIAPHRRRVETEDLDEKFKDENNPLRIVFVCAMWMTGFDVPCCSTIYLDKPMRNHTLMQTIARANRVFPEKNNGLIVDYVNVFRDLHKALAIYGSGYGGDMPVLDKGVLVARLREAIAATTALCTELGVDIEALLAAAEFRFVKLFGDAVAAVLINDQTKDRFLAAANKVNRYYKAILPDKAAGEFSRVVTLFDNLAFKVRSPDRPVDISGILGKIEIILDESIKANGYEIGAVSGDRLIDLSKLDFGKLKAEFEAHRKTIEAQKLRAAIEDKLYAMVRINRTRVDFAERFRELIADYNAGSFNVDEFFNRLVAFAQSLSEEEQRHVREGLTEEEQTIVDLLTKPYIELSEKDARNVKAIARDLLETLKREKLVLDWRKRQQTRAAVRLAIEEALDKLPGAYTKELYEAKCNLLYEYVYESYYGEGKYNVFNY